jgi:hypothetical protein
MIQTIHEHSYDSSLLPERANILDLGCLGFLFTKHMRNLGHATFAVDLGIFHDEDYHRCAISDYDGDALIKRNNDPQATRIVKHNFPVLNPRTAEDLIDCYKLSTFSKKLVGVDFWDLIKMDVEGSEYQVIMSLEKAPSKQLSIEFHLHTGIYGQYEMTLMEDKLKALGYIQVKHELTAEHCAGYNYWDSLFILK